MGLTCGLCTWQPSTGGKPRRRRRKEQDGPGLRISRLLPQACSQLFAQTYALLNGTQAHPPTTPEVSILQACSSQNSSWGGMECPRVQEKHLLTSRVGSSRGAPGELWRGQLVMQRLMQAARTRQLLPLKPQLQRHELHWRSLPTIAPQGQVRAGKETLL